MSDPVVSLDWPEEEDSLAVTIAEVEHDLRSDSWDQAVVLARLGQIRDRAVMEEQAAARRAEDLAEERDLRAVTREKLAEVVARAENAEAEVAEIGAALDREHGYVKRLETKVAHLPHDIAEAILLRAERTKDWSGTPRSPVEAAWRRGLQDAAAIARTHAEAPDA